MLMMDPYVPGQRATRACSVVPAGLVGKWTDGRGVYEITDSGRYYVSAVSPYAFSISPDGKQLTILSTVYVRIGGSGPQIPGIWFNAGVGEELYFRADGTYTSHWDDGEDYHGTYSVEGSKVGFAEWRGMIWVTGGQLVFDWFYMPQVECTYELAGNQVSFTCPSTSFTLTKM